MNMKFKPGDIVPATTLESVTGEPIKLPDPNRLVHLQFRRFVDCPICNTHIAELRGMAHGHFGLRLSGGPLGLPGDFLIAPSGQIKAAKYGTHAYDQWSVDELIALAKSATVQAA